MIEEFLKWWLSQLADLVPAPLRPAARGSANALIGELPEDWDQASHASSIDLLFIQRRNGRELRLGRFTTGSVAVTRLRAAARQRGQPAEVRLRVPARLLLERQVVLPLATEREMNNVLRYEMDRLTPFKAEQVFWAATIERRDPARSRLILRLSTIPKAALAGPIAALNAAGLAITAIEVAPGATTGQPTRVIGLLDRPAGASAARLAPGLAAGACGVLALVAVGLPFYLQSRRAVALNHQMVLLAPRVEQAERLRQGLTAAATTGNIIAAARAEIGDPLAVLAAVTGALPNNSFLTELTLNHGKLEIAGQSAAAAALLAALSAYPILTNVAFSAPVVRNAGGQADLFSIQSDVAPE